MSDCLHCDINEVISEYITWPPKPLDAAEMAAMIAQSLGEFTRFAPQAEQANFLADSITALGAVFLDKSDEELGTPAERIGPLAGFRLDVFGDDLEVQSA